MLLFVSLKHKSLKTGLILTGLYFSFKMKFPQVRRLKSFVKASSKGTSSDKGLNQIQSFIFTAARTVGVGNIAGMATGIHFGGPGAIFWLWILAIFGSPIAMIEGIMAQTYKVEVNGEYRGGPSYYIDKGFKNKKVGRILALFYSVVGVIAAAFLMPGVQTYNIVKGMNLAFNVNMVVAGFVFAIILGVIIIGGLKRIANLATSLVPSMSIFYIVVGVLVIILNIRQVPMIILQIFTEAFSFNATIWSKPAATSTNFPISIGFLVFLSTGKFFISIVSVILVFPHAYISPSLESPTLNEGPMAISATFPSNASGNFIISFPGAVSF